MVIEKKVKGTKNLKQEKVPSSEMTQRLLTSRKPTTLPKYTNDVTLRLEVGSQRKRQCFVFRPHKDKFSVF